MKIYKKFKTNTISSYMNKNKINKLIKSDLARGNKNTKMINKLIVYSISPTSYPIRQNPLKIKISKILNIPKVSTCHKLINKILTLNHNLYQIYFIKLI